MKGFFKKYPLATQILLRVFSIYFIIATLVTSIHIYWQYYDTKFFVAKETEYASSMLSESLAKAIWIYNDDQITKILNGVEILPFIRSAIVVDTEGETYRSDGKENKELNFFLQNQDSFIEYSIPLTINDQGSLQTVGQLTLYGDNTYLFKRLELGFWLLIINALIKTMAIWFIFIGVGYVMISKPLHKLTKAAKTFNLTSTEPMPININVSQKNELSILESTFNEMAKRLFATKTQLEYKGNYDGLTGLPNRQLFLDRLTQAIQKSFRTDYTVALLYIDLDRFKEINDSLGHHVGDEVLKKISCKLLSKIKSTDTLAHLGGDEFTVILDLLPDKNSVIDVIDKMNQAMDKPVFIEQQPLYSTLSIGIAFYPEDGDTAELLLKHADAAMYEAKNEGRNNYKHYSKHMTTKSFDHISMVSNLRSALEHHQFVIYYQPQIAAEDGHIYAMEALVRWEHPELGLVAPDKFISFAEKTGLIIPLGEEIFDIASKQIAQWMKNSSIHYRVAINLSVKEFEQENIVSKLTAMLAKNRCNPEWIELEITEGYIIKNPELAIKTLQDFREMGIEISIDDFGTGYSSLSYLKRLPINTLKIDQSFVRELAEHEDDKAIVKSIISLSKAMNLNVIAEGVETLEQKQWLLAHGCKNMQGYLYSKPVSATEMGNLLRNGTIDR